MTAAKLLYALRQPLLGFRSVLHTLGRPHAYVSCVLHSKPGSLLQAALNQLRVRARLSHITTSPVLPYAYGRPSLKRCRQPLVGEQSRACRYKQALLDI